MLAFPHERDIARQLYSNKAIQHSLGEGLIPTDEDELSLEGTSLIPTALINCRVSAMSGEKRIDNFLFHNIALRNTLQPCSEYENYIYWYLRTQ